MSSNIVSKFVSFSQPKLMQTAKVWEVLKNSGNWLHYRHTNIENWFINSWENWIERWHHCFAFSFFGSHFSLNSKVGRFCIWFLKIGKFSYWKKAQFQGCLKLAYFLISHFSDFWSQLQNQPNVRCWGCFGKFRKFAARWAQEFFKLLKKCLRQLKPKLATLKIQPTKNEPIWAYPEI